MGCRGIRCVLRTFYLQGLDENSTITIVDGTSGDLPA